MNGSFVVSVLAGVTLVTAASLVMVRLARKTRAATRHVWLVSTFVTLLLLPAVSIIAPRRELTIPPVGETSVVAPAIELITRAGPIAPASPTPQPGASGDIRIVRSPSWPTVLL